LPRGATINDIRQKLLRRVGDHVWGEGTPIVAYGGESYVTLPMGRVLRITLKWVPPKGEKMKWKTKQISYERHYVLDRGIVKTIKPPADLEGRFWSPTDGTPHHLFLESCSVRTRAARRTAASSRRSCARSGSHPRATNERTVGRRVRRYRRRPCSLVSFWRRSPTLGQVAMP
jgi:hypothetical protein